MQTNGGKMKLLVSTLLTTLLLFVACAEQQEAVAEQETMAAKPARVLNLEEVTTEGTVTAVDPANRLATVQYGENDFVVVEVQPDVDMSDIEVGDRVRATYLASTAFYVQAPDSTRPAMQEKRMVEYGEDRSKLTVDVMEKTLTVEALDLETRMVTLKDGQGNVETIQAAPELQNLENVKVGDQVVVRHTEAVAVRLEEIQ
jgi:phage baseplate assembly protein gpV